MRLFRRCCLLNRSPNFNHDKNTPIPNFVSAHLAQSQPFNFQKAANGEISPQDEYAMTSFVEDEITRCARFFLRKLSERLARQTAKHNIQKPKGLTGCQSTLGYLLCFFAAESMQVDIHLRSPNPKGSCESMEMRSYSCTRGIISSQCLAALIGRELRIAPLVEKRTPKPLKSFHIFQTLCPKTTVSVYTFFPSCLIIAEKKYYKGVFFRKIDNPIRLTGKTRVPAFYTR